MRDDAREVRHQLYAFAHERVVAARDVEGGLGAKRCSDRAESRDSPERACGAPMKLAEERRELREQVEECWAKAASAFRQGNLDGHRFYADAAGRLADRLENYINELVSASDEQFNLFAYGEVAIQLSASREDIKELLRRIGGRRNGITIVKQPLTDV